MTEKGKKALRWIIQTAVLGVIGFFLVRAVVRNWSQIKDFPWHFEPLLLLASLLILGGTLLYMIVLWRGLLVRLGARMRLGAAFRIFSISALGRYLPGKIWQVVGMVYLGRKEGVRAEAGVWGAVLAQVLAVLSGVLVTLGALFLEQERMLAPLLERIGVEEISLWWLLLPLAGILALLHPRILQRLTNWLLRLLKREPLKFNLSYAGLLGFFLMYVLSWGFYGTALFLFISSLNPLPLSDWVLVTGGFTGAYVVGLLAVFVPGGLGVREGLLALFLTSILGAGVAVALSFAQRLWFTAMELTFVLISVIFTRRRNGSKEVT